MTWTPRHFPIVAISGWMNREQQQVAHSQINAATVVKALSPIGDAPANEAQAWPLTRIRDKAGKLDLPRGKRVWAKVVTIYPPSAGGVRHLTAKRIEPIVAARSYGFGAVSRRPPPCRVAALPVPSPP
jgi:hypothetical protein